MTSVTRMSERALSVPKTPVVAKSPQHCRGYRCASRSRPSACSRPRVETAEHDCYCAIGQERDGFLIINGFAAPVWAVTLTKVGYLFRHTADALIRPVSRPPTTRSGRHQRRGRASGRCGVVHPARRGHTRRMLTPARFDQSQHPTNILAPTVVVDARRRRVFAVGAGSPGPVF
jgi:hypothetical protein